MKITFYNWTVLPPPFSQECRGASQSCSSTALDRTCCKRRQPPSPLATPFAGFNTMRFLSLWVRTAIAHVPQRTSWSANACTADHNSGHATPSLGWIWLPCGCVYSEDGGGRFPRNLWRHFTELYAVTYQEPYLASQTCIHCKDETVNAVWENGRVLWEWCRLQAPQCEQQMCAGKG
jgi:hypothetical protein